MITPVDVTARATQPPLLDAGNPGSTFFVEHHATTQTHHRDHGRTYSVTVTNPSGCSDTFDATVTLYLNSVADLGPDTVSVRRPTARAGCRQLLASATCGAPTPLKTITATNERRVLGGGDNGSASRRIPSTGPASIAGGHADGRPCARTSRPCWMPETPAQLPVERQRHLADHRGERQRHIHGHGDHAPSNAAPPSMPWWTWYPTRGGPWRAETPCSVMAMCSCSMPGNPAPPCALGAPGRTPEPST